MSGGIDTSNYISDTFTNSEWPPAVDIGSSAVILSSSVIQLSSYVRQLSGVIVL